MIFTNNNHKTAKNDCYEEKGGESYVRNVK